MRRLLGLVLAALLLAACSGSAVAPEADAGPDAGPGPVVEGQELLAFSATTIEGGQIEGSSLEGRDVVLWFWAPW